MDSLYEGGSSAADVFSVNGAIAKLDRLRILEAVLGPRGNLSNGGCYGIKAYFIFGARFVVVRNGVGSPPDQ